MSDPTACTTQSNHAPAVEKLAAMFPQREVRGWMVVHPQSDGKVSVTCCSTTALTLLVDADTLMREVGDWLSPSGEVLDLFVVAGVLEHRNW